MTRRILYSVLGVVALLLLLAGIAYFNPELRVKQPQELVEQVLSPTPPLQLQTPPSQKILATDYHIFQTFNNCGPAAMSMALRFYGIDKSQQELGLELRPHQNPEGINDDKSVTLEELAEKSKEFGFIPFHRPNGNVKLIKYFITYDIPVVTRTWTHPDEDIGHYRVVKGYDETTGELIQDDSLQNKNLRYKYEDFDVLWEKFNYEYLVMVPKDKVEIAEAILKEEVDEKVAWQNAVERARQRLSENSGDVNARFNLAIALFNTGDAQGSINEYEKIEKNQLPFRTLWYQIEPILAYKEAGDHNRVFQMTDRILNNQNRAFAELYKIRGDIYLEQGNQEAARNEYQLAVFYNQNYRPAQEALENL